MILFTVQVSINKIIPWKATKFQKLIEVLTAGGTRAVSEVESTERPLLPVNLKISPV